MIALLTTAESALAYEDGWMEYIKTHRKPRKNDGFDSYLSAACDAGWVAMNKAQAKKLLLAIGVEKKRVDGTTYLTPDYAKYKQALKEIGLGD